MLFKVLPLNCLEAKVDLRHYARKMFKCDGRTDVKNVVHVSFIVYLFTYSDFDSPKCKTLSTSDLFLPALDVQT